MKDIVEVITKSSSETCKSSWITHMISTNQQMYSSVRDYIVKSERIGSLLKENNWHK